MKTDVMSAGKKVVAIASSTGGPKALQEVIPLLPKSLKAPVLIVQHMPAGFTAALADRLDNLSPMKVCEAREGDILEDGQVYMAKGGCHMNVVRQAGRHVIHYTDEPPREGVRPCANFMYESLAESTYDEVICVVMTGMGADGTAGIKNLQSKKKTTVISQSEDTCIVYGMPRSVVLAGISQAEVPLTEIANEIIKNVGVV
ncbi:MAG: chemotaxis protein CheB [Lachnospiraceae bacterium]|nr:chemotaxis protein CheB [Lachnospiraceae bacterium]